MKTMQTLPTLALALAAIATGSLSNGCEPPIPCEGADCEGPSSIVILTGDIVDYANLPLSGRVELLTLGRATGIEVRFRDGRYSIPVRRDMLLDPSAQSSTLLMFHPDREDRVPLGTPEGDPVHVMPVTIAEFADAGGLAEADTVELRPVEVPLQGRAYPLAPGRQAREVRMAWPINDRTYGALTVELIAEAGTVVTYPDDVDQHALTLTHVTDQRTPMRCDRNEAGDETACLLWTLQPTGTTFDPPLRLEIRGDSGFLFADAPPALRERFPLRIASPLGWRHVGEVEVSRSDDASVVFASLGGVVDLAGWGHVIGRALLEGALILRVQTCDGPAFTGRVIPVPVISRDQPDYRHWNDIAVPAGAGGAIRLVCDRPVHAPIYLRVEADEAPDGVRTTYRFDIECRPGERTNLVFSFDTAQFRQCP
ncbi:MAG: hypothetical protein KC620_12375 [Myxococcales bacterium]|nr:hypothetical protein [Myxococcales bacterium]